MTQFEKINFTTKDVVQLLGGAFLIGSMWFDLKTEIVKSKEQREFLQHQISQHEKKIDDIDKDLKAIMSFRNEAVKPEEPRIKMQR